MSVITRFIARRVTDPSDDGQNLQQFMSDSPWSGSAVFKQIQTEIKERRELQEGMLTLDESGDEGAGALMCRSCPSIFRTIGQSRNGASGSGIGLLCW